MANNNLIRKIANSYEDSVFDSVKKEELIKMFESLGLNIDDSKFGHIKAIDNFFKTDFVESASYVFPSASGNYKGRRIEIAPSYSVNGVSDIGWRFIDSPSVLIKRGTSGAAYDYMVVGIEMKENIGTKRILIFPKNFVNQVSALISFLKTSSVGYKEFDERYLIVIKDQVWFQKCLDKEIMDSMINLDLPGFRGATFQFSKNRATFAILPGVIGAEKIEKAIDILERIINNIERIKERS